MNIFDVYRENRVPFLEDGHEHTRRGWVQTDCPLCSPGSGHWRLGFNLAYGYFNCWACGPADTGDMLSLLTGLPLQDSLDLLKGIARERPRQKERLHEGVFKPPTGLGPVSQPHRAYLWDRGFSASEIERLWKIRGIAIHSYLSWRIYIPVIWRGQEVGWTTRSISDSHPQRYRSGHEHEWAVSKKDVLYGFDYVRHACTVHEGPLDVWAVGPGAVATLGTGFSTAQVRLLAGVPVRAVCFDNTADGRKRARELADKLAPFPGKTHVVTLDAKDAAAASEKEIAQLRRRFLDG